MKKLLSLLIMLIFFSSISVGCTTIKNIVNEKAQEEENINENKDTNQEENINENTKNENTNNSQSNNSNNENSSEKPKTELKTVRIFAFDYEEPELYYYDTDITVVDNALVIALTNELQHNLPEERFLALTDKVGVKSAKLDSNKGILTVVFNEAFTEKMLLGSVTESGLLASLLSTYAYNYGVDKVAIYFGDTLYTSLRGELPEGYFTVDYSSAKPISN